MRTWRRAAGRCLSCAQIGLDRVVESIRHVFTGASSGLNVTVGLRSTAMRRPGETTAEAIRASELTIYDDLSGRQDLVYGIDELEGRLNALLRGLVWDFPQKTRAKVSKAAVAEALGYPIPKSFTKTTPRFPGQGLDVHVQAKDNLQIWNSEVGPTRRYVLIRVDADGVVTNVRVVTGEAVALWDRTGTLTSKYQAKRPSGSGDGSKLVSATDTAPFIAAFEPSPALDPAVLQRTKATDRPEPGLVLSVQAVYERLQTLIGREFDDPGATRDRLRGIVFQQLACDALGVGTYADGGQFPDILSQALEVKLQLSTTIDLGLVLPDSAIQAQELGHNLVHADTRYAVAYASRPQDKRVRVDSVVVSTGADFFTEFQRFEGKVQNKKQQIPLPRDLFETE